MREVVKVRSAGALDTFVERYCAVLVAAANRVHRLTSGHQTLGGKPWVSSEEVAEYIAKNLPELYTKSFGRGGGLPLKVWRVRSMFSHASYLGAWEALGVRCVRGRGLSATDTKKRPHLRVVK